MTEKAYNRRRDQKIAMESYGFQLIQSLRGK